MTTFVGSTVPREIARGLVKVSHTDGETLSMWLEEALALLLGNERAEEDAVADDEGAVTALFLLAKTAVEQRVSREQLRTDLTELKVPADFVNVFTERLHRERFNIEAKLRTSMPKHARLRSFDWRIDIVVASARTQDISQPSIWLRFLLDDGREKRLQVSVEQLHKLRYTIAKLLNSMGELEYHPMVRIMDILEADQCKKL